MKTDALDLSHSKGPGSHDVERGMFLRFFVLAASLNRKGVSVLRIGLVIVLVWIGALKFANYEADSIVRHDERQTSSGQCNTIEGVRRLPRHRDVSSRDVCSSRTSLC